MERLGKVAVETGRFPMFGCGRAPLSVVEAVNLCAGRLVSASKGLLNNFMLTEVAI